MAVFFSLQCTCTEDDTSSTKSVFVGYLLCFHIPGGIIYQVQFSSRRKDVNNVLLHYILFSRTYENTKNVEDC